MDAKSIYLIDAFVNVRLGEPYRLFPFGKIYKNGQTIDLTPELATQFKLPHFKPAIKLGGHDDALSAGGHIIGLEVRADGVYAIPEWNDNGTAALEGGAFRYHSPEIIWEGGVLDSSTGKVINAPVIMGDALLHNPALGEATAFFSVEKNDGGHNMSEMTQVPTPLWEKFTAWIDTAVSNKEEPNPTPEPPDLSQYEAKIEAAEAKAAEYEAKIEAMETAADTAARIAKFGAELKEAKAVSDDNELHTILAQLPEEQANALVTKFKALSAQIDESGLTNEQGDAGNGQPVTKANLVVMANEYAKEHKVSYTAAVAILAKEKPELFKEVE